MTVYTGFIEGGLSLFPGDDASGVTGVEGSVIAYGSARISLPACTSVGSWVRAYNDAHIDLPLCASVGGWVVAFDGARISMPACASVGGRVVASDGACIDLRDGCLVGCERDTLLPGPWIVPLGNQSRMVRFFRARDGAIVTHLGCFRGTIPNAVAAIREKYGEGSDYEQTLVEAAAKIETGN